MLNTDVALIAPHSATTRVLSHLSLQNICLFVVADRRGTSFETSKRRAPSVPITMWSRCFEDQRLLFCSVWRCWARAPKSHKYIDLN